MPGGILIVFEGIDGAGKTTQVSMLAAALKKAGEEPVCSKEPTDGFWGRRIRESAFSKRMPPQEELEAFVNDRLEHAKDLIVPNLNAGRIVILDRYYLSTIAYQGARGADIRKLEREMETTFPNPNIAFVLDVDPDVSLRRISEFRGDVPNEFEKLDQLQRAKGIFNSMRSGYISHLDGHLSIKEIYSHVVSTLISGPLRVSRCRKEYGCDNEFVCSYRLNQSCDWWNLKTRLASPID